MCIAESLPEPAVRLEGEIIPEGWSVTEGEKKWYLRYRQGSSIILLKIPRLRDGSKLEVGLFKGKEL